MQRERIHMKAGWVCLLVVGTGILAFGVITAAIPTSENEGLMRANGLAATGMGLFGVLITLFPFRHGERWAWFAQWFYPAFWTVHLVGQLPPGKDHIHQVVFLMLSLVGLLLPVREFFPRVGRQV
ncbi:hypothetical protein [Streptomyces chiangmaiensis]|uniref:SPW repeat-containing protein n=1 Tax=Streptomyces chiangmaiensis TaxID=766497 RepID=A0ABU7FRA0_9ACTN|nr:hypothetical protein [Streptomyces chiangmaiensis]MED7826358.1 hypothetical protein [Streptomyces chiangmaiensis]